MEGGQRRASQARACKQPRTPLPPRTSPRSALLSASITPRTVMGPASTSGASPAGGHGWPEGGRHGKMRAVRPSAMAGALGRTLPHSTDRTRSPAMKYTAAPLDLSMNAEVRRAAQQALWLPQSATWHFRLQYEAPWHASHREAAALPHMVHDILAVVHG